MQNRNCFRWPFISTSIIIHRILLFVMIFAWLFKKERKESLYIYIVLAYGVVEDPQIIHQKMGRNLVNALVAILAPLPSIILYLSFLKQYEQITNASRDDGDTSFAAILWTWCFHHPLLLANVLFFFNVNLLFWIISHIQSSHWVRFPLSIIIPL